MQVFEVFKQVMCVTGVIFWTITSFLGLFALYDLILWKIADMVIKKYKLTNDFYAFVKNRWQKRA